MTKAGIKLSGIAVVVALAASASRAQSEPHYAELPKFHKVNERLCRGAQPKRGGIKKLAELRIKTIVNLRGEDERTRDEEAEAKAAGLRYFNIPMPGLKRPTDDQVSRVMAVIAAPENQPVFIHCNHGSDRTGTIIAIYRMSHDGWTGDHALAEAKHYGMNWVQFGMKRYISHYSKVHERVKQAETPALAVP